MNLVVVLKEACQLHLNQFTMVDAVPVLKMFEIYHFLSFVMSVVAIKLSAFCSRLWKIWPLSLLSNHLLEWSTSVWVPLLFVFKKNRFCKSHAWIDCLEIYYWVFVWNWVVVYPMCMMMSTSVSKCFKPCSVFRCSVPVTLCSSKPDFVQSRKKEI